eukprot:TRINITY_DN115_c0_g1_i3.p1 TRINITY_DN115_c0_g1~~TRINITY_DN115_c0_g1_i3.p1  ORF type:complete len:300 (+),score=70.78 TRINITY_DN115_c0_g1_i3:83-982(+)
MAAVLSSKVTPQVIYQSLSRTCFPESHRRIVVSAKREYAPVTCRSKLSFPAVGSRIALSFVLPLSLSLATAFPAFSQETEEILAAQFLSEPETLLEEVTSQVEKPDIAFEVADAPEIVAESVPQDVVTEVDSPKADIVEEVPEVVVVDEIIEIEIAPEEPAPEVVPEETSEESLPEIVVEEVVVEVVSEDPAPVSEGAAPAVPEAEAPAFEPEGVEAEVIAPEPEPAPVKKDLITEGAAPAVPEAEAPASEPEVVEAEVIAPEPEPAPVKKDLITELLERSKLNKEKNDKARISSYYQL